jgi:hypothetical protein
MPMDSKRIEGLLKKYWECETTLEEEQELRTYFSGNDIPQEYKQAAPLFQYFNESKKKSLKDVSFDKHVINSVSQKKGGKIISLFHNSMRIAAGIAVLMIAFIFIRKEIRKTTPQEMVDTFNDPQLAFEETKKALMIISKGIGTAEQEAKKINLFNEAQEEIQKSKGNEQDL